MLVSRLVGLGLVEELATDFEESMEETDADGHLFLFGRLVFATIVVVEVNGIEFNTSALILTAFLLNVD